MLREDKVALSALAATFVVIGTVIAVAVANTPPMVEQEREACASRVCPAPSRPLAIDTGKHGHPDGMFCVCAAGEP